MSFCFQPHDLDDLEVGKLADTLIISFQRPLSWEDLSALGCQNSAFNARVLHSKGAYQLDFELRPEKSGVFDLRWSLQKFYGRLVKTLKPRKIAIFVSPSGCDQLIAEDILAFHSNHFFTGFDTPVDIHCANGQNLWRKKLELSWSYRGWINANPDEMTSFHIGEQVHDIAKSNTTVQALTLEGEDLRQERLNLLKAVGRASSFSPPMLHIAQYLPSTKTRLTLIGKGVTFDTGGINIKPYTSYVNCMKNDMGGGALAFHIFKYLIEQEVAFGVDLLIPCCENSVDEKAMKPGSIITSHSGHEVFIDHTDAEGRLILADAISYAEKRLAAVNSYTMATLTTAALQQFGNFLTPTYFLSKEQKYALDGLAAVHGEEFTHYNFQRWYDVANQHTTGARTNRGNLRGAAAMGGRSNVAAHFLKFFAKNKLAHFDIFNTVWNWSGEYPGNTFGATGAPLHSLCQFFTEKAFD